MQGDGTASSRAAFADVVRQALGKGDCVSAGKERRRILLVDHGLTR
jgi:hypothetical protein